VSARPTNQVTVKVSDQVSWHRGDLPRGTGTVVEIKKGLHMVRDERNNVYGFREEQLRIS
jgi:hypothetical protein